LIWKEGGQGKEKRPKARFLATSIRTGAYKGRLGRKNMRRGEGRLGSTERGSNEAAVMRDEHDFFFARCWRGVTHPQKSLQNKGGLVSLGKSVRAGAFAKRDEGILELVGKS